jgi:hypothetical protein
MLPIALSKVLGISLSEVMIHYFDRSSDDERVRQIENTLDWRRSEEEGEEWLAGGAHRRSAILEQVHQNREDDSF